jgi:hypothetical protein
MIVDPGVLPLARRLQQEIESLGLGVKMVAADAPHPSSLEDEALAAGAVAAIHIAPMGGGDVDMTILDGATGKTVSWKLVAATTAEPAAAELIATRTVELLRASLIELASRRPSRVEAAAPQRITTIAQPTDEPRERGGVLSLLVGPALLYSANFRPGAQFEASATWMPLRRVGFTGSVLAPMVAPRLTSREGSVDVFASQYRVGALVELGAHASSTSVRCLLGGELARLHFDGTSNAPYVSASDYRTTVSPWAGFALRFQIVPSLYMVTEFTAALSFPRTVIRLASREAATWGRPVGSTAIGLEFAWPLADRPRMDVPPAATGSP